MSYQARNASRAARKGNFKCDNVAYNGVERGEVFNKDGRKFSTVDVLQKFCEVNNLECDYASEYGEPGYTNPEKGILFCDWNRVPDSLQKRLEAQGYELEWSDEWYIHSESSPCKAYRTAPDSYGWESQLRACDGYYLTPDDDASEWIDDAVNDNGRPLPSWIDDSDLEKEGFALVDENDKEVGMHPGQNETPEKFTPALTANGLDFVLQITGRRQFDTKYRIWTRKAGA